MKTYLRSGLACLVAGFTLQGVAADAQPRHGAMEVPPARQLVCHNAADYSWPEDGSDIKSAGCKAAYQHVYEKFGQNAQQAAYQFNQWHEVSKNVKDYRNMAAVKEAIPDGQLCSAGNSVTPDERTAATDESSTEKALVNDKSGLDVVADWQAYDLAKDVDGKTRMRYKIAAQHNPSYWQIYVSKPDYDANVSPLKWDDLELVQELGDVQPVDGYYDLDVDLKNHTGRRVIYSRWQREDPAGEGFYNCSDVNIVSSK